jgi:hypothetical protein
MDPHHSPQAIACTLDAAEVQTRIDEWTSLASDFRRHATTSSGATLWFDPTAEGTLRSLAAKEAACCAFLRLDVHPEDRAVRLDITSAQPEARPVIDLLARQASGSQETA